MAVTTRLWTAEELDKIPQSDALVELVRGEIVIKPLSGYVHGEISGNISVTLYNFSRTDISLLTESDTLEGGEVLPGFSIGVREVFEG